MNPNSCGKCIKSFLPPNRIPKILNCGHTFCHICLTDFINKKTSCPSCNAPITKSLEEYTTNFSVLSLNEIYKSLTPESNLECIFNLLKTKLLNQKSLLEENFEKKMTLNKDLITKGIISIDQILEINVNRINSTAVENLFLDFTSYFTKIDAFLDSCYITELKPTYTLDEHNKNIFLNDLVNRILNGECIYAYVISPIIEPKYGKLDVVNHRIHVQAFTLSKVDSSSSLVSFKDLKECITGDNFRTFMNIGERTLSFLITDSSFLASQFVKLCSGENGPTFKGHKFVKSQKELPLATASNSETGTGTGTHDHLQNASRKEYVRVVMIETIDLLNIKEFSDYDFGNFCAAKETIGSLGNMIVQMGPNGLCSIHKQATEFYTSQNVVAKVENPKDGSNLFEFNNYEINDSGITLIY